MTRELGPLFTHSQEEAILQGYGLLGDIDGHIDMGNLSPFNSENCFSSQQLANYETYDHQIDDNQSLDHKMNLGTAVAVLQQMPNITTPVLANNDFSGDYNFELIIRHANPPKNWVYSELLSKVFIRMEEALPLQFQWNPPNDGLWIRATMVYKSDQDRSKPVIRCPNHRVPENNSNHNIDPRQINHVVRCEHPASTYVDNYGNLSVLTPLGAPAAGVSYVQMNYTFFCKNSCTSGMNRRPTELILTLETSQNEILGRKKLEVRVCSCPKRDKEKEEKESLPHTSKKRKINPNPPPGKKLSQDLNVYNLNFNVVGKDNANAVLKYAADVMSGSVMRNGNSKCIKPHIDEVLKISLSQ